MCGGLRSASDLCSSQGVAQRLILLRCNQDLESPSDSSKSWAVLHRTSARCVLDTTSHLRGRPASRSSSHLGWKQFVAVVEQLVYVRAKSEFSRRKVRNEGGTTIGRRCLTLRDRGLMAGRGRVSRCSLPLEARGLESRSPFCPATSWPLP